MYRLDKTEPAVPPQSYNPAAIPELLAELSSVKYDFVPPTNDTMRLVRRRKERAAPGDLRDVFGWSLPFEIEAIPPQIRACALAAGVLHPDDAGWFSSIRVSKVEGFLFAHSATRAVEATPFSWVLTATASPEP